MMTITNSELRPGSRTELNASFDQDTKNHTRGWIPTYVKGLAGAEVLAPWVFTRILSEVAGAKRRNRRRTSIRPTPATSSANTRAARRTMRTERSRRRKPRLRPGPTLPPRYATKRSRRSPTRSWLGRRSSAGCFAREEGKILAEGIGEVLRAGQILAFFAGEALRIAGEKLASVRPNIDVEITREP